jgi:hypothetical protein
MIDSTALVGLRIQLRRTIDRPCVMCGESVVVIGFGAGPHVASLHCAGCARHRGWLPRLIADFLIEMIAKFGWPPATIAIRNASTAGMGAPAIGNQSSTLNQKGS